MERKRRSVGEARTGHEKVGLERDPRRRRQTVHRRAPAAARTTRARSRMFRLRPCPLRPTRRFPSTTPMLRSWRTSLRRRNPPTRLSKPQVTSSAGPIDAARLSDGDLAHAVSLPYGEGTRPGSSSRTRSPSESSPSQSLWRVPRAWRPPTSPPVARSGWKRVTDGQSFRPDRGCAPQTGRPQQTLAFQAGHGAFLSPGPRATRSPTQCTGSLFGRPAGTAAERPQRF